VKKWGRYSDTTDMHLRAFGIGLEHMIEAHNDEGILELVCTTALLYVV